VNSGTAETTQQMAREKLSMTQEFCKKDMKLDDRNICIGRKAFFISRDQ
jgi:hypothetical protein